MKSPLWKCGFRFEPEFPDEEQKGLSWAAISNQETVHHRKTHFEETRLWRL